MEMHGIVWAYILVLILKNLDISRFMEIYRITKPGVYLTIPSFMFVFLLIVLELARMGVGRLRAPYFSTYTPRSLGWERRLQ